MSAEAKNQIKHETIKLLNRYQEESDLDEEDIVQACTDGLNEWLNEEIVVFDEDEDEDLPEGFIIEE
tara:strand:+ start:928 stop:1128 length:201 start_codon:yes stop_codon:yes gene_type:complete